METAPPTHMGPRIAAIAKTDLRNPWPNPTPCIQDNAVQWSTTWNITKYIVMMKLTSTNCQHFKFPDIIKKRRRKGASSYILILAPSLTCYTNWLFIGVLDYGQDPWRANYFYTKSYTTCELPVCAFETQPDGRIHFLPCTCQLSKSHDLLH